MKIIRVRNLSKVYKTYKRKEGLLAAFLSLFNRKYVEKTAAKDVSFDIDEGEIVGFIGPNGAGKSTVIKMMTGILVPTSGEIKVLDFVPFEQREEYVKHIGVVFGQKSQLWWDIPPIDAFSLLKDIYQIPEKEFKQRLDYMINLLNLKDISETPVRNLSLGERMRCELVAALLHNPKVVFLDEPTIGLDVVAKEHIRKFIKDVNKKYHTTFIVTTHDMNDIEELCERIIIIDKGKLVYDGLLEKLRKKYLKSKILTVVLEAPYRKKFIMSGTKTTKSDEYTISIKVNLEKQKLSHVIQKLLDHYMIADISIEEISVEEVIKKIYGGSDVGL
jgi:ABC-2 type transport system ATP-binding protein